MRAIRIIGTGSFLPRLSYTNADMEQRVTGYDYHYGRESLKKEQHGDVDQMTDSEVFDAWTRQLTGVETRFWAMDYDAIISQMADPRNCAKFVDDPMVSLAIAEMEARRIRNARLTNRELFDSTTRYEYPAPAREFFCDDGALGNDKFFGSTENMGVIAARRAMEKAEVKAKDLDFIIFATVTPTYDISHPAVTAAHILGAKDVAGYTINAACSAFGEAMIAAFEKMNANPHRYSTGLIIACETLSKKTRMDDPKTAVLLGDGAGAVVVRADEINGDPKNASGILGYWSGLDYSPHITALASELMEFTGGKRIYSSAVRAMEQAMKKGIEDAVARGNLPQGFTPSQLDMLSPHQANLRIIEGTAERLGLPMSQVYVTVDKYANISGASSALTLDLAATGEIGPKLERGMLIGITTVGAGYDKCGFVQRW